MDNNTTIISLVTILVTFVLGIVSKKSKFIKNNLIPVQNLLIGCIAFVINYIITKDANASLIGVGLFTGGAYDLVKNIQLIKPNDTESDKFQIASEQIPENLSEKTESEENEDE